MAGPPLLNFLQPTILSSTEFPVASLEDQFTSVTRMYVLTAQWLFPVLAVVWATRATADAQITPPTPVLRARETQSPTIISTITSVNLLSGLSFCFGDGGICSYANQLSNDCQSFENNISDLSPWYQCICENGYVSTNQQ